MGFRLEIYWAADGDGEGSRDIFEPLVPLPRAGNNVQWDEWRVCFYRVAVYNDGKPPVWGVAVFKHSPAAGAKFVSARSNWDFVRAYCLHSAGDRDEYMAWLDQNVDLIACDNITIFKSSRVDEDDYDDDEKDAVAALIDALS